MLNSDQLILLDFLKKYPVADQRACHTVLDFDKTGDWKALSYRMRPLVKNKYIARSNTDGLYSLLKKGRRQTFSFMEPLIKCSGKQDDRKRAALVAGIAALFEYHGIHNLDRIPPDGMNGFIPSPIWRKLREGLVSSTMFLGMLYYGGLRLPVYDIGDGQMHWQIYGERSLHFYTYGKYETRATGVLMVCDDGMGVTIGKQIIHQTMLERKRLIKDPSDYSWENPKKRPVSKSQIKLHTDYQYVYLAERGEVMDILKAAVAKKSINEHFCKRLNLEESGSLWGSYLENHPDRYHINLENDILKLAVLFKKLKDFTSSEIRYHIIMRDKYENLARMYDLNLDVQSVSEEDIQCLTK